MSILTFHSIGESFYPGITNYGRDRLYKLLEKLQRSGHTFVSLRDFIKDQTNIQNLAVAFDDGYSNFYLKARPILQELNIPAIVFIPAGYIGRNADWDYTSRVKPLRHLTRSQIEECRRGNISFGSHGLSHTALTSLSDRQLKKEMETSKKILEDITGREVSVISYPFGRYNRKVEESAEAAGFVNGLTPGLKMDFNSGFTLAGHPVYAYDTFYSILRKIRSGFSGRLERFKESTINSYSCGTVVFQKTLQAGARHD